jgi:hypothetical protein
MTIVGANTSLPNRPRSLLPFLGLWVASYLAPLFLTSVAAFLVVLTAYGSTPDGGQSRAAVVWLCLFPSGLAFSQWLLARRYMENPLPWTVATFGAALLGQLANRFVPELTGDTIGNMPQLIWVFGILDRAFGFQIAAATLTEFPPALCYGVAWSLPQGLALPRPRSAKIVWIATLMPTGFVLMVMAKALSNELLDASFDYGYRFWFSTALAYVLPGLTSWATLSLVSGSLMYWNLRRSSDAGDVQVYARFD